MASDGEDRISANFTMRRRTGSMKRPEPAASGRLIDPGRSCPCNSFPGLGKSGLMTGAIVNFDQSVWGAYGVSPHPDPAALAADEVSYV